MKVMTRGTSPVVHLFVSRDLRVWRDDYLVFLQKVAPVFLWVQILFFEFHTLFGNQVRRSNLDQVMALKLPCILSERHHFVLKLFQFCSLLVWELSLSPFLRLSHWHVLWFDWIEHLIFVLLDRFDVRLLLRMFFVHLLELFFRLSSSKNGAGQDDS